MLARLSQRLLPHLNSTLRARASLARVCGVKPSRAFHSMDTSGLNSRVCAVLGAQWGDEGKGKLVDVLVHHYDICGRFNGGANAGHTLVVDGRKFAFHVLPCGLVTPGKKNVIGNGVVLHVPSMLEELAQLDEAGIEYRSRLFISDRAHLLFDVHRAIDARQEAVLDGKSIGTTKKGIGPCYASKALRHGVRVGELRKWTSFEARFRTMIGDLSAMYGEDVLACDVDAELERYREYAELIGPMITDTVHLVNSAYRNNESILAEGANAALLDLDYGTYPFVTSSATTGGGISTGLGVAPTLIDTTIGVVKAYTTRVGSGPFPTELEDEVGAALRDNGHEYGTTTGRPRRCGWLDLPVVNYSHMVNNYQSLNITKLDVLDTLDEVKIGTHYRLRGERLPFGMMPAHLEDLAEVEVEYESMPGWKTDLTKVRRFKDLPPNAQAYINRIEELTGISVSWIGVGPEREAMVTKGFDVKV